MFRAVEGESSLSTPYAFTLTLKPHVRKDTAEMQYDKYVPHVKNQFKQLFGEGTLYSMIVEFTKSYDIHFHGTIKFHRKCFGRYKNIPRFFSDSFRGDRIIGYVLLKQITDDKAWNAYCGKDLKVVEDDLSRSPIINNDLCIDYSIYEYHKLNI